MIKIIDDIRCVNICWYHKTDCSYDLNYCKFFIFLFAKFDFTTVAVAANAFNFKEILIFFNS